MNKTAKRTVMALAACMALCGTAMAAPRGNPPKGGHAHAAPVAMRAPVQQASRVKNAPPQARHAAKAPTPPQKNVHVAVKPAKHQPKPQVARHNPPPPPARHHQPKHHHDNHRHDNHHSDTLHTEDWCEIGASFLGGLVGGLISASI